jgi:hypothetical protein
VASVDIDRGIQKAIDIGESNKRIIELAQNWCGQLTVEKCGGTGVVEVETGLPIGMRRFKCPHASAAGLAGMNLEVVALDFYDRNCAGCQKRVPVRFPNLSELVAERDAARSRAEEAEREAAEITTQALRKRAARRAELSRSCEPATAAIFARIDELDGLPTEENKRLLLETAVASPSSFTPQVREALFELADAGGFARTQATLEVLQRVEAEKDRLCEVALRALAREEGLRVAGPIVADCLSRAQEQLIPAALPGLIHLALPISGLLDMAGSPGESKPLVAVYQLFPDLVKAAICDQLRVPLKGVRIAACNAISAVSQVNPRFGLTVADELIRSLELPDDPYGEKGSAEGWVRSTLAGTMLQFPDEIDALIERESNVASDEVRGALLQVYDEVLRSARHAKEAPGRAHELAFERLVAALAQRPKGERLTTLIWFLRHQAGRFLDILERNAERLLGAAALIAADLDKPSSPLLDLDLTPDPLKRLETESQRQCLYQALGATAQALGLAAAGNPESIGRLVVQTFGTLDETHAHLKAALVKCVGRMGTTAKAISLALPVLYQAMTSRLALVRAAAAEAYAGLARGSPEDLPALAHETFLVLLTDPYVIVHSAAVDALREVALPNPYTAKATLYLANLVSSYSESRSNDRILSECVDRFIEVVKDLPAKARRVLLSIMDGMEVRVAARLVTRHASELRGTPGLGDLLAKLLGDPETDEYSIDDLLGELKEVSAQEISQSVEGLRSAAKACATRGIDVVDELTEILSAAGLWAAAADVARDATERLTDSTWDRPRKLRSALRQVAAEIEAAAAASDVDRVLELTRNWRALEREVKEDDERNKEKRGPIFGLRLPHSGE